MKSSKKNLLVYLLNLLSENCNNQADLLRQRSQILFEIKQTIEYSEDKEDGSTVQKV